MQEHTSIMHSIMIIENGNVNPYLLHLCGTPLLYELICCAIPTAQCLALLMWSSLSGPAADAASFPCMRD